MKLSTTHPPTRPLALRRAPLALRRAPLALRRAPLALRRAPLALGLLGLTLGTALAGGHAARAQACALSLSTTTPTVAVGGTATFTVSLTGGTGLGQYNINVLVNPAQLKFVGTPLFTSSAAGTAAFPVAFTPQVSANGGDLNFAAGNFAAFNNPGVTALGTFQVQVLAALPLAGSAVTFGPIGTAGGFGGTAVSDGSVPANNELTAATGAALFTPPAAPEPSQWAAMAVGALGLAALALRARKAKLSV